MSILLVLMLSMALGGKLSLTVHYPDRLLECPNSLLLAVNELVGWDVENATTGYPIVPSIMLHIAPDTWWLGIPYDTESFTKTIFSRYVLYNPCSVLQRTRPHQYSTSQEMPICKYGWCRNVGKGDVIYLSESGLSAFDAYPYFYKSEGAIRTFLNFPAPQLPGGKRDITVYVPPGLLENPTPRGVPVIYMFDGQELPSFFQMLNTFHISGFIRELVIVGIPSTVNRTFELTPTECQPPPPVCNGYAFLCPGEPSGGLPLSLSFIEDNVHPFILANLSISASEVSAAGWSLGGLAACESLYRSKMITKAYCGSPAIWWNCNEFVRTYQTRPEGAVAYLDGGLGEVVIWQPAKTTFEHFSKMDGFARGGNLWYDLVEGDFHDKASWFNRFPLVVQTLYGK